jgi:phosphoglycerate kinase
VTLLTMSDVDLKDKRVLIREDFNVPMKNGEITNDARIQAAIPTIKAALDAGAAVILMSHLGRPTEGMPAVELSLAPIAVYLSEVLGQAVKFQEHWGVLDVDVKPGEVVLLENVRFFNGEGKNDKVLAQQMARLCDVFVMDAFATAHRTAASTVGISQFAPVACAGPLLMKELDALERAMKDPARPLMAIVGGAKVSTKLKLLQSLADIVDVMIVGGGIANTFLAAQGYVVGDSLYEPELIDEALQIIEKMEQRKKILPLPLDVVVAEQLSASAEAYDKPVQDVVDDEKILDVGPKTAAIYAKLIAKAGTILWNGPVGAFEVEAFAKGTEAVAKAVAASPADSVAGGGDTIAALAKYGLSDKMSYISTGGGAFLTYLEGKTLPAVAALKQVSVVKSS